ncbi:MAG: NBR1-Ig-like domain-containing protein [Anaerolineales bacterium]
MLALAACQTSTPLAPTPIPAESTPTYTLTPQPTATSTSPPEATPAPTEVVDCRDDILFLNDLTIPDGTSFSPGELLDKRWSVENSGTCDWGPGYRLVRIGQDAFEGPEAVDLYPARAGATAVLQVLLQAPQVPGEYISLWQAQAPDGTFFGEELYLLIVVVAQ